ncbi:transformation system, type II secretion system ATPase CtsE [Campylobacter vicugnae]|uniref:Transformation system, type II secretion system ATPase CtsE n=1 Tax=Campylobacter vicugnae TaxID=1660076 RepID=A0A1X9SZI0_9BACT|nr:GspE/PulE family protein [Campylobacter sp. RM8964]ARR01661.1 transformation system, type II secretion system ATPase CtsE [Campylobacter sp. RM8964]
MNEIISKLQSGAITLKEAAKELGISQDELGIILSDKFGYEIADMKAIDYSLADSLPLDMMMKFEILPIKFESNSIYIAMKNPFDTATILKLRNIYKDKIIKLLIAPSTMLDRELSRLSLHYGLSDIISQVRVQISSKSSSDDSAVLRLIDRVLISAIKLGSSDIHIEPTSLASSIRVRVDGVLCELFEFDKDIYNSLISRLKLLANLDIAEYKKPQDGRFSYFINDRNIDFRISVLPVIGGQSVVLRILDTHKMIVNLQNLGLNESNLNSLKRSISKSYGMILVTGPTGSGKTTTIYSALNELKGSTKKIITIEEPIEYQMSHLQQVAVGHRTGISFEEALRSALRQDPDIIMIGEIRDHQSLRTAIGSALTGHLVLSTLHTNDAISAIDRMTDMGLERYLISGAVIAIMAQRLARKLCQHCKEKVEHNRYKAHGCAHCIGTGYSGRVVISEILEISPHLASLIAKGESSQMILTEAIKEGFVPMQNSAMKLVESGITSLEEILSIT